MENIPVYEVVFDESIESGTYGVTAISLVDKPAIMQDFMKFKEQKEKIKVFFDEDKHTIIGPALIPDLLIYRVYECREFFIRFSKEVIEDLAFKYFMDGYWDNITIMHEEGDTPFSCLQDGIECTHYWIEAEDFQEAKNYGFDLPLGTWMVGFKVYNEDIWKRIKSMELRGFSIECFIDLKM